METRADYDDLLDALQNDGDWEDDDATDATASDAIVVPKTAQLTTMTANPGVSDKKQTVNASSKCCPPPPFTL